ncbi:MAG TPA: hypothetical protein VFE24_01580 [Pirellulales bacterium]|jgi:hypothetical protein|nr:hypothetical protein [Pirellulales bacterium]
MAERWTVDAMLDKLERLTVVPDVWYSFSAQISSRNRAAGGRDYYHVNIYRGKNLQAVKFVDASGATLSELDRNIKRGLAHPICEPLFPEAWPTPPAAAAAEAFEWGAEKIFPARAAGAGPPSDLALV